MDEYEEFKEIIEDDKFDERMDKYISEEFKQRLMK